MRVTRSQAPSVSPRVVAAFLPLRLEIRNRTDGPARVGVARVGRVLVKPGARSVLRSEGLKPGRVRITAPGGSAFLRVRPGGG